MRSVKSGDAEIEIQSPFSYGHLLFSRVPKNSREVEVIRTHLDAIAAADCVSQSTLPEQPRVSNTRLTERHFSLFPVLFEDERRFTELPSGGGGIDWLNVSITRGAINERGRMIRLKLLQARDEGRCAGVKWQEVRLDGISEPFMVFHNAIGQGAIKQPLMVQWQGLTIRYGKVLESYPKSGGHNGGIGVVECPGLTCLKRGEAGLLKLMGELCQALGIEVEGCRATRLDACADLVDCDIEIFSKAVDRQQFCSHATDVTVHYQNKRCTGVTAKSIPLTLNIYDKVTEIIRGGDEEKKALMIQNRWGQMPEKAVRVEFQFTLGSLSAMKFDSLEALFEGVGVLMEWACNDWFRLCDASSHAERAKPRLASDRVLAGWMRVTHAFAYWAGRFNLRPIPPVVVPAEPAKLVAQVRGQVCALLAKLGYRDDKGGRGREIIVDESTGYDILARYFGPNALRKGLRKAAARLDAKRGYCELPGAYKLRDTPEGRAEEDAAVDAMVDAADDLTGTCDCCGRLAKGHEFAAFYPQIGTGVCVDCLPASEIIVADAERYDTRGLVLCDTCDCVKHASEFVKFNERDGIGTCTDCVYGPEEEAEGGVSAGNVPVVRKGPPPRKV